MRKELYSIEEICDYIYGHYSYRSFIDIEEPQLDVAINLLDKLYKTEYLELKEYVYLCFICVQKSRLRATEFVSALNKDSLSMVERKVYKDLFFARKDYTLLALTFENYEKLVDGFRLTTGNRCLEIHGYIPEAELKDVLLLRNNFMVLGNTLLHYGGTQARILNSMSDGSIYFSDSLKIGIRKRLLYERNIT